MRLNAIKWIIGAWRDAAARHSVISEYHALAQYRFLMADIARRGGVFATQPPSHGDVFENGRREGRREFAIELLELARCDTEALSALVARYSSTREEKSR